MDGWSIFSTHKSSLADSWAEDGWKFSVLKKGDSMMIPAGCYHRAISWPGTIAAIRIARKRKGRR